METERSPWRNRLSEAAARAVPGDGAQRTLLWWLLALAALLRLWNLPDIPFTHDEISALVRVRFHSLPELIAQGVAVDAHPAGVQVFEWLWTGLFGTGEVAVKLPFILMSVAALFLLYRFAASWASPVAALLSIAFIGCIQYTVMYGQIARPYAFGFFTCALLMDGITRLLGGRKRAWITVALAMALCFYTHYFSFLFAVLAWLFTLPLGDKRQRRALLIAGGVALLCLLPHIPISIRQYGYKGVGQWLLPPDPSWVPAYITWIFEYSKALAVVVLGTGLAGWVLVYRKPLGRLQPFIPLCLALGILPFAIGYAYSVWRAPVLQFSVLLYSFPFLVFPLFAGWRTMKKGVLAALVVVIAGTAVYGLVVDRQHYRIFYSSKYEAAAKGIIEAAQHQGRAAIVDLPAEIPGFYFRQWDVDSTHVPYINLRGRSPFGVDSALAPIKASSVFFAHSTGGDPENTARVQALFPFLLERHDMEEGQTFLFSAVPGGNRLDDHGWSGMITPMAIAGEGWSVDPALHTWQDTTDRYAPQAWDMTGREFGITLDKPIYQIIPDANAVIEVRMDATAATGTGLKLVVELLEGGHSVFYRSRPLPKGTGARTAITAMELADIPGHGHGGQLHAYVWNEGGRTAHITSMQAMVREGNPWLHGLFQPILRPLKYR